MATARKRTPGQPRAKGSPPKLLSWPKTKRALAQLGIDPHRFIDAYENLENARGPRELDPKLLSAGEQFARDGDFGAFKKAIGLRNDQQANARLGRYFKNKMRLVAERRD